MAALSYFLSEALISIRRSRGVSSLAVGTIAVALAILGVFLYFSGNMNDLVARWSDEVEVSVYLRDDIRPGALRSLEEYLRGVDEVAAVEYISKEEALDRFRAYFSELEGITDALGTNPLPASLEVQLTREARSPVTVQRLAESVQALEGVEEVEFDTGWVKRLHSLATTLATAGYALGGILLLAAIFTTSNVIRLSMFSRRDEVEILRLVGATPWFIQGPYVVEGVLQGMVGGILALLALYGVHLSLNIAVPSTGNVFFHLLTTRFLSAGMACGLVLAGGAMGLTGALFAVRKFLSRA